MASIRHVAALAVLLLAPAVSSAADAPRNYIAGSVTDRNGMPVSRAIVTLSPGNVQLVTDNDGRYLIDYLRDDGGERTKLLRRTDYEVEIYKPGFHPENRGFYYKKGAVQVEAIVVLEDTINIEDDKADLDPSLYADRAQSDGANYEGQ